jgi:hypothetical protein
VEDMKRERMAPLHTRVRIHIYIAEKIKLGGEAEFRIPFNSY